MKAVKMLLGAVVVLAVPSVSEVAHAEMVFGIETSTVRNSYPNDQVGFSDSAFFGDVTSPCTGVCRLFGQVRGDVFGVHVALGRSRIGAFAEDGKTIDPLYVLDFLGMTTFGERVKGDVRMKKVGMLGLSLLESTEESECNYVCANSGCTRAVLLCPDIGESDVTIGVKVVGGVEIAFGGSWIAQGCVEYADYELLREFVSTRNVDQLALTFRFGYRF